MKKVKYTGKTSKVKKQEAESERKGVKKGKKMMKLKTAVKKTFGVGY